MKRLLQINATCNWGSTGRIADSIAAIASKQGWDCYLAHGGRYINPTNQKSIRVSSRIDNYFHAFKGVFGGRNGLGSFYSTRSFIKRIEELEPSIIHLHNIHGYYINYTLLFDFLNSSNIPVVWTLHDCWALTGHCTHFDAIGCMKWKTGCFECPLLHQQYKSLIWDKSFDNYKLKKKYFTSITNLTIVPVSEWLSSIVSDSFLGRYPRTVIRNGIDLSTFTPRECSKAFREGLKVPTSKPIALGVSSAWDDEKGLAEFNRLADDDSLRIVLVGVQKRIVSKINPRIIAIPMVSNPVVLSYYYSLADVFVNPTYNDSYPTVNMESMACGTPVVTYNTGGSPEMISEKTGCVVERGDYSSLHVGVKEILTRGKSSFQNSCINRAQRLFNSTERYNDYINLYEHLICK